MDILSHSYHFVKAIKRAAPLSQKDSGAVCDFVKNITTFVCNNYLLSVLFFNIGYVLPLIVPILQTFSKSNPT